MDVLCKFFFPTVCLWLSSALAGLGAKNVGASETPSHTRDDYGDQQPIPSSFSDRLACIAHIGTGLLSLNHPSELSTFVITGRFPFLVVRYEASAPGKIYLFIKILLLRC